jgi:hypothetical protein
LDVFFICGSSMINPDTILEAIESLPPNQSTEERNYLGASEIGHPCSRYLWLKFHKFIDPEVFEPRMLRLFFRGQREEGFFEAMLRDSGFEIIENCMSQARFKDGFFSGAGDGVVGKDGLRFAVEFKTANDATFKGYKRGELKKYRPTYFAQCQINAKKFDCVGTIYLAVNKNDDSLFCDIIMVDEVEIEAIEAKATYITTTDKPPERIAKRPTDFACKFCPAKNVCFGFDLPRVNCRNCVNATKFKSTGTFGCELKRPSDSNNQLDERGWCEQHVFNPHYMNDAYGWNIVEFHPKERAVQYEHVINGPAPFGVPSKELKIE